MHRHRHPRGVAALLAPLLAGSLTLAGTASAHAAADSPDSSQTNRSYSAGTYVVQLSDEPVATYEGGLPRLKQTAPESGKRFDADSGAVKNYLRHLDTRRDDVLDAVPGVKKLYDYDYALNGFAARLTGRQATRLANTPGVVSVTPSKGHRITPPADRMAPADSAPTAPTATTITKSITPATAAEGSVTAPPPDIPRFLGLSGKKGLWSKAGGPEHAGEGMIIGMIDTGFDPENPMLAPLPEPRPDAEVIAKKWHGRCVEGDDSAPEAMITCNNKVIGADWFHAGAPGPSGAEVPSPLDTDSHGTHTATTAAGNYDTPASIPGTNVSGTLSGVAPAARLAVYKACWDRYCQDVDTAAAIDRAVADGVDVISFSIGNTLSDPTSMAMFNAAKAGVFVSAAASNSGPNTVENTAPWVTTVAATTHDTKYDYALVLGDGSRFPNSGFSTGVPSAPLINAVDARKESADATEAAMCFTGTLDPAKAKGKIVACDRGVNLIVDKADEVRDAGGVAVIVSNTPSSSQSSLWGDFSVPMFPLGQEDGAKVRAYAATEGAAAELTPSQRVRTQAPAVSEFSSGGPDPFSNGDLLKPDLSAPGSMIAAGTVPGGAAGFAGSFGFMDGTSMATPHISGLAALLKSLHPGWSPMEVKSALMTTASATDNEGKPIGRQRPTGQQGADSATPLDYGAGQVRPALAADPGLVYDSTSADWTSYLCSIGQEPTADDGTDACATAPRTDPSDLNYASIAVGDLAGHQTLTRTVTNVATATATYQATLQTPPGYTAQVTPKRLTLRPGESATYKVKLTRTDAAYGDWSDGSLTWSDAHSHHRVTSPIALRATLLAAPDEVSVDGRNPTTLTTRVGWTGDLTAKADIYTPEKTTGTLTGTDTTDFAADPHTSDAVAKTQIHVPQDAPFTRVATTEADHMPGSDLDLYAFDADGTLFSASTKAGSDEHADLPPGDYDVYVVQSQLPEGSTSQQFTLWTWKVGQNTPAVRAVVTPATQQVVAGDLRDLTVTWPGTVPGERDLGVVEYGDGSSTVGRTTLTFTQ